MASLARLPMMLLLGSFFLAMVVSGHVLRENDEDSQQSKNPYLFRSKNFKTRFQNDLGHIRILPRFDQRHPHLRGLRNFRLSNFELKPHSLFLPHHRDAENLLVVIEGRAIATIVNQTNKETYQLEQGDVIRVPAGNLVYAANVEENQNFRAANLLIPINIPGRYENFYPSGNQNPRSYYRAFSEKTLEATFNSNYNEIRKILFGKEEESSNEGVIVKLSKEEARELRRHAESSSLPWTPPRRISPSSSSSRPVFNLKNLPPRYSNDHGNLWEARPEQFDLLRELDMSVTILELKKGSLFLPHYNTKAITVAQILDGRAKLELASPHLARDRSEEEDEDEEEDDENKSDEKEEERREGQIQRVSSTVKQGDVFVALAGHPFALRTPKKNNLWMVAFLLDAQNNQRNFLGGERDNVINQIERVVKDQSFEGSGEEVEKLLRNQKKSYFVNAEQSSDDDSNVITM